MAPITLRSLTHVIWRLNRCGELIEDIQYIKKQQSAPEEDADIAQASIASRMDVIRGWLFELPDNAFLNKVKEHLDHNPAGYNEDLKAATALWEGFVHHPTHVTCEAQHLHAAQRPALAQQTTKAESTTAITQSVGNGRHLEPLPEVSQAQAGTMAVNPHPALVPSHNKSLLPLHFSEEVHMEDTHMDNLLFDFSVKQAAAPQHHMSPSVMQLGFGFGMLPSKALSTQAQSNATSPYWSVGGEACRQNMLSQADIRMQQPHSDASTTSAGTDAAAVPAMFTKPAQQAAQHPLHAWQVGHGGNASLKCQKANSSWDYWVQQGDVVAAHTDPRFRYAQHATHGRTVSDPGVMLTQPSPPRTALVHRADLYPHAVNPKRQRLSRFAALPRGRGPEISPIRLTSALQRDCHQPAYDRQHDRSGSLAGMVTGRRARSASPAHHRSQGLACHPLQWQAAGSHSPGCHRTPQQHDTGSRGTTMSADGGRHALFRSDERSNSRVAGSDDQYRPVLDHDLHRAGELCQTNGVHSHTFRHSETQQTGNSQEMRYYNPVRVPTSMDVRLVTDIDQYLAGHNQRDGARHPESRHATNGAPRSTAMAGRATARLPVVPVAIRPLVASHDFRPGAQQPLITPPPSQSHYDRLRSRGGHVTLPKSRLGPKDSSRERTNPVRSEDSSKAGNDRLGSYDNRRARNCRVGCMDSSKKRDHSARYHDVGKRAKYDPSVTGKHQAARRDSSRNDLRNPDQCNQQQPLSTIKGAIQPPALPAAPNGPSAASLPEWLALGSLTAAQTVVALQTAVAGNTSMTGQQQQSAAHMSQQQGVTDVTSQAVKESAEQLGWRSLLSN